MFSKTKEAKYSVIVDDGSSSSSDSMPLEKMEKQSLMGQGLGLGGDVKKRGGGRMASVVSRMGGTWLVNLLLALANVVLVLAVVSISTGGGRQRGVDGGGHRIWMPPEHSRTSLFTFQTLYGKDLNNESEAAWNALMPVGRGFVIVKNDSAIPDQPGLDQSIAEQKAMVSVFHQLHCLYMTREGYYSALAGRRSQVSSAHLMHCFDYLRQTIMCFGDTTLEWLPAPPRDNGSTGWGYEHKCRDFGAISRWVEENRLKTTHGIH